MRRAASAAAAGAILLVCSIRRGGEACSVERFPPAPLHAQQAQLQTPLRATAPHPLPLSSRSQFRDVENGQTSHTPWHLVCCDSTRGNRLTSAIVAAMFMATTVLTPLELKVSTEASRFVPSAMSIQLQYSSRANALTEDQLLVADVWKEVTKQYVDPTFNGLGEEGWRQKRLEAVKAVANLNHPDDDNNNKALVYAKIQTMLASLNDPYTRFLTPEQYESLTAYAKGASAGGVGVSLLVDPSSGHVVVANTSKDGPAQTGGISPGDVMLEVDGMDVQTATAEVVAAKCRGPAGSNVNVVVRHDNGKAQALTLTRAKIQVNPVQVSTLSIKNKKIGLLTVCAFNQETTSQIVNALRQIKGASAIAIDLRGNAGGYMPAGVDVAKLFLSPQTRIISEVDKSGRATIYVADGIGSETQVPLYILVDKRTASASEILTAALQDNHRAVIVGSTETFGKGRIQNVQPLEDGSGIAVTKAKYTTPSGRDIHGVGITPDIKTQSCGPDDSATTCLTDVI